MKARIHWALDAGSLAGRVAGTLSPESQQACWALTFRVAPTDSTSWTADVQRSDGTWLRLAVASLEECMEACRRTADDAVTRQFLDRQAQLFG
jgi:hypothetical protein